MDYKDKYFKFEYKLHIPDKKVETGIAYQKRRIFDPNLAKNWVKANVLKGIGDVTLLPYVEIQKEGYDLNMDAQ
jgi:hypothetical protein